jgi:orotate phosphoribosyltransferase-like protein
MAIAIDAHTLNIANVDDRRCVLANVDDHRSRYSSMAQCFHSMKNACNNAKHTSALIVGGAIARAAFFT